MIDLTDDDEPSGSKQAKKRGAPLVLEGIGSMERVPKQLKVEGAKRSETELAELDKLDKSAKMESGELDALAESIELAVSGDLADLDQSVEVKEELSDTSTVDFDARDE